MFEDEKYDRHAEEYAFWALLTGGTWITVVIICFFLTAASTLAYWVAAPYIARHEHSVNTQSHQYQEARKESEFIHESELARVRAEFAKTKDPQVRRALQGQIQVLERRIKRERAKQQPHGGAF